MPAVPEEDGSISGRSAPRWCSLLSAQRPIIDPEGICGFAVVVVEQSSFCFALLGN